MRTMAAAILGIALVVLGVAAGQAQGWIQIAGTIQAFDCQNNSLVLRAQDGVHVFTMAPNAALFINGASAAFCTLRQYAGYYAVAPVGAFGGQFFAGRVDVYTSAVAPPPGYYPVPYYPYYGGPFFGVGIGIGGGGHFHDHHFGGHHFQRHGGGGLHYRH